ncbi:hypothetical protein QCA50_002610 [Cerrena zonata]|uniref:HAT C-terminal dimerisation domain-containing protein n=1 Tax=Cerrena zonata TaxID=2478898 RepID=A0AAW0GID1_9APHY
MAKIKPKQMKRSVETHWNTLAKVIQRALYLCAAIDKVVSLSKYDKNGKKGLRQYRLLSMEWNILRQLGHVLGAFLEATLHISKSKMPLLHEVIPLIDSCTAILESAVTDVSNHQSIRVVMHPRYKLEYFRRHKWEPEWIRTTEDILRDQWTWYYQDSNATPSTSQCDRSQMQDSVVSYFDIDDFGTTPDGDLLAEYLESLTIRGCADLIQYWSSLLAGGDPRAQMALDFLSAPATSTDIERAFSCGGLTVLKCRHALSDKSTRAATVLSSWAHVKGLIPEEDMVRAMKERNKRTKKTKTPNVYVDEKSDGLEAV